MYLSFAPKKLKNNPQSCSEILFTFYMKPLIESCLEYITTNFNMKFNRKGFAM